MVAKAYNNPYRLKDKLWQFVQHYLREFNAAEAARQAGYSRRNADKIGWEILENPRVQAALQAEIAKLMATYEVTPDKVVREYARLAFSDMRNYAEWDGTGVHLKASAALDEDAARAVAEVSETTRTFGDTAIRSLKFKLHSKHEGLQGLARFLDLFGDTKALGELGQGLASLLTQAKAARDGPHEPEAQRL